MIVDGFIRFRAPERWAHFQFQAAAADFQANCICVRRSAHTCCSSARDPRERRDAPIQLFPNLNTLRRLLALARSFISVFALQPIRIQLWRILLIQRFLVVNSIGARISHRSLSSIHCFPFLMSVLFFGFPQPRLSLIYVSMAISGSEAKAKRKVRTSFGAGQHENVESVRRNVSRWFGSVVSDGICRRFWRRQEAANAANLLDGRERN